MGKKMIKETKRIDLKNTAVPNWFFKEHAEVFLNHKLTDREWTEIVKKCPQQLCEEISNIFEEWLKDFYKNEARKWKSFIKNLHPNR